MFNLDAEIEKLEQQLQIVGCLPISIYRILMAYNKMIGKGFKPLPWQKPGLEYYVWVFGIGPNKLDLNPFYYGHTIHQAICKMRKAVKHSQKMRVQNWNLTKRPQMVTK